MLQNYISTFTSPSYNFDEHTTAEIPQASCHSAFQELADELELWFSSSLPSNRPDYASFEYLAPHSGISSTTEHEFEYPELWLEGNDTTVDEFNVDTAPTNLNELYDKDAEGEIYIQHEDTILCTYSASDLSNMLYKFNEDIAIDHEISRSSTISRNIFATPPSPGLSCHSPSPPPPNSTSSSLLTFKDWKIRSSEPKAASTSRKRKIEDLKQESNEEGDRYEKTIDPSGKAAYQCRTCSHYRTPFIRDMRRHLESLRHKEPSHICDPTVYSFGCGRAFTRADALKRHQQLVDHAASQPKFRVAQFIPKSEPSERFRKRQRN